LLCSGFWFSESCRPQVGNRLLRSRRPQGDQIFLEVALICYAFL
jgi:hypothetical protein